MQAHGNAVVGSSSRPLTDAEFAFVDRVFTGTTPRRRIILTDTLGAGDRELTCPSMERMISVNIGPAYPDPGQVGAGHAGTRAHSRVADQALGQDDLLHRVGDSNSDRTQARTRQREPRRRDHRVPAHRVSAQFSARTR